MRSALQLRSVTHARLHVQLGTFLPLVLMIALPVDLCVFWMQMDAPRGPLLTAFLDVMSHLLTMVRIIVRVPARLQAHSAESAAYRCDQCLCRFLCSVALSCRAQGYMFQQGSATCTIVEGVPQWQPAPLRCTEVGNPVNTDCQLLASTGKECLSDGMTTVGVCALPHFSFLHTQCQVE